MTPPDDYAFAKFGIDEIYFHKGFTPVLLEKLNQRASFSLDAENIIARKYTTHDMILIFHNRVPTQSMIYRFLESLDQKADKKSYIESNTLINEEELFLAIKAKKFVLVTYRNLIKDNSLSLTQSKL